jgi:hypothetical protein
MSKKWLYTLIREIFDYLSRDDVYINVYDPYFDDLIFDD